MGLIANLFVNLNINNKKLKSDLIKTTKQLETSFNRIGLGLTMALGGFLRHGIKQASDFAENWSVVSNAVAKDIQDNIMSSFSSLKRVTKSQFADIAATIVGTLKSKGVDDALIGELAPNVIKRLEDTGAFYNKTTDEVLHAFTSMISGMARPMEMLTKGAVVPLVANLDRLSEEKFGMKFDKLAPDQQTLMRLQFFLDGTAKVPFLVNNSAKTIGTWKGQMDSMKKSVADTSAVFAQKLMPTLAKMIPVLSKIADFVANNAKLVTGLAGAFMAFKIGAFVGEMLKGIGLLMAWGAAKTFSQTGMAAIAAVPAAIGAVGAVVGGVLAANGVSSSFGSSGSSSGQPQAAPMAPVNITVISSDPDLRVNGNGANFGRGGE